MSTDLVPIRRALISVSDKSGLEPLVRALAARGCELVSTGGTAAFIQSLGEKVTPVESLTGFPEMMDGRVKTLHPKVHGGVLAVRDSAAHARSMAEHGIAPIDLVCINLYPFEKTVSRPGVSEHDAIENIDIGGPALIRSAAKNHAWVCVVTDAHQYARVIAEIERNAGATSLALRRELARAAYARTGQYDAAIAEWFGTTAAAGRSENSAPETDLPEVFRAAYPKVSELRYGENPHQRAALYRDPGFHAPAGSLLPTIVGATQLHGIELGYNNLNDAAAAAALADELATHSGAVGACVIKHANPCGAACAASSLHAISNALAGDPMAAYGGVLACSGSIDVPSAERLCAQGVFLEVIIAPRYAPPALEMLKARWANVRLLAIAPAAATPGGGEQLAVRSIPGGLLVQDRDTALPDTAQWSHVSGPTPSDARLKTAASLWVMVKHLSSNAVAVGGEAPDSSAGAPMLFGAGAGQMDRVASCRLAVEKAGRRAAGAIAVSDAFFPFPDGPEILLNAGVTMIVHPGGSKRDHETFDLCERRGVTCMTTGVRHFRH